MKLTRHLSPEEKEIELKKLELSSLENVLVQSELLLVTLKAELTAFEDRYSRTIGILYAELDEADAKFAEKKAKNDPTDKDAQQKAQEARSRAEESARSTQSTLSNEPRENFKPTESLKKLYRELAKKLHPDFAKDDVDRERRHRLMALANQAYESSDENMLRQLLDEVELNKALQKKEDFGTQLVRIIRQIAAAKRRIREIEEEIDSLKCSELYLLMVRVDEALLEGRDLLSEMVDLLREQINAINQKRND